MESIENFIEEIKDAAADAGISDRLSFSVTLRDTHLMDVVYRYAHQSSNDRAVVLAFGVLLTIILSGDDDLVKTKEFLFGKLIEEAAEVAVEIGFLNYHTKQYNSFSDSIDIAVNQVSLYRELCDLINCTLQSWDFWSELQTSKHANLFFMIVMNAIQALRNYDAMVIEGGNVSSRPSSFTNFGGWIASQYRRDRRMRDSFAIPFIISSLMKFRPDLSYSAFVEGTMTLINCAHYEDTQRADGSIFGDEPLTSLALLVHLTEQTREKV